MTMAPDASVVMFARERCCPDVARTRQRLTELGISWIERDVEADDTATEMHRLRGRSNVPTVLIGDRAPVVPSNSELDAALVTAGFTISVADPSS